MRVIGVPRNLREETAPPTASSPLVAVATRRAPPAAFVERSGALLGLPVVDWCRSRRSGSGTFRATIQTVGPTDVPCWSDFVAAR